MKGIVSTTRALPPVLTACLPSDRDVSRDGFCASNEHTSLPDGAENTVPLHAAGPGGWRGHRKICTHERSADTVTETVRNLNENTSTLRKTNGTTETGGFGPNPGRRPSELSCLKSHPPPKRVSRPARNADPGLDRVRCTLLTVDQIP